MKITEELIRSGMSAKGGWTEEQVELLGVPWPPKRGWIKRACGTEISVAAAALFRSLGTGKAPKQQKQPKGLLSQFWRRVESDEDRLSLLMEFAQKGMPNDVPLQERRQHFDRKKWKMPLRHEVCWCCRRSPAEHRHHIVLLLHGGTNDEKNIVPVCVKCHERVHPWMEKPLVELAPEFYTPLWRSVEKPM